MQPPGTFSSPFTSRQRSAILAVVCFSGILSPLSSLMYTPALPAISSALGVSISDVNLTVTTYLIFQGITPSIWGSISDVYGRRPVYLITLLITVGASIGLCLTNSFAVVLILRALHATGCSSTRALGAGVIRDIAPPNVRGGYMGFYSAGVGVGTAFGPVIGGILAQYTSWHGIFDFTLALAVLSFLCVLFLLPETLQSAVQNNSAMRSPYLRAPIPWFSHSSASFDAAEKPTIHNPPSSPKLDFLGPLRIMKYPDVLCSLVYTGICYTVWQDSMVATSTIYSYQYGLSEAQIGLTYVSNGIGSLIGNIVIGRVLNYDYRRQAKLENAGSSNALTIEHARMRSLSYNVPLFTACMLAFGWIIQSHIHISVSVILAFFIGWLDSSILSTFSTLMVDLFEDTASASSASINLVRCLLGAVGSSTIELMISAMGVGWSFTTLFCILIVSAPLVWYQYCFGARYRAHRFVQRHSVDASKSPQNGTSPLPPPYSSYGAPPVAFPPDFAPRKGERKSYEFADVNICDSALLKALARIYGSPSNVSIRDIVVSAFCATLFRITRQDDGMFGFRPHGSNSRVPFSYRINPDSVPSDVVLEVASSLSDVPIKDDYESNADPLVLLSFGAASKHSKHLDATIPQCEWELELDGRALRSRIHFAKNLYDVASIHTFAGVFSRVLKSFALYPSSPIARLPLSTSEDLGSIKKWNNTHKEPLDFASVGDMFRYWARKIPDSVAVENGDHSLSLTYRQLDHWSDALASWILVQLRGTGEETIIGVYQTRSAVLVVSYLACLKAGCAYMPIDMSLPAERIYNMILQSKSPLVLGHGPHAFPCEDIVRYVDLETLDIERLLRISSMSPISALLSVKPDRLSSVIFTSGSTGTPKAIMIQHSCLLNFVLSDYKPIEQGDRTAMILSIAFDVSSGEIWYPLARGATLVCHIQPPNSPFDVEHLSLFLESENINSFHAPTAVLKALVEANFFDKPLPSLRSVAIGGEAAFLELLKPIMNAKPHLILSNNYGPSESTIDATFFPIPSNYQHANVSIGRPMTNIGAYVVDTGLNLVPSGVCGELVLTGRSLARGYLGREDLTSEAFIHLSEEHHLGSVRAYRTGDLVRQTATGELYFVRRLNHGQVKLRGHRVELGEVERAIEQHPLVSSAVAVVCHYGREDDRLVVYMTSGSGSDSTQGLAEIIRAHARSLLPAYMVPSTILLVPSFPLSTTGKLDRRLMSSPRFFDQVLASVLPVAKPNGDSNPHSPEEAIVLDIFAQALGVPQGSIGLDDNLFDLGGHSLIATRIINAIRRRFGVSFGMTLFYNNASVSGVVSSLLECDREDVNLGRITKLDTQDLCPASDSQTRLWVEEQMNPGLSRYNAGFQRKLTGPLDVGALKKAFLALVDRHEALRTVFEMQDPVLMQRVVPLDRCSPVRLVDLQDIARSDPRNVEELARSLLVEEHARPFNLAETIPSRFLMIKISPNIHFVSAIIHHIATDGWSTGLIDRDLTILYNSFSTGAQPSLDPLPLRYRDYSVWQRQHANHGRLQKELDYWSEHLQGARPLELRTDYVRPQKLSGSAHEIPITIDDATVMALRRLAATHRTSLYVVLLAAFRTAVFRVTGEDDGAIGMVNANRPRAELEGIVGFFVNTHAVRLPIESHTTFEDMMVETKNATGAALENSEVPWDKVVAHLAPQRDLSRNALVQLMFVLQDFSGVSASQHGRGLQGLAVEDIRNASTRLDLSLHLFVDGGELRGYFMYQTDIFDSSTIQTFSDIFTRVIGASIRHPSIPLSRIPLTKTEDLGKLSVWNATEKKAPGLTASIGERFREVASLHGSSMAVVDRSVSLTYAMLDEQSDRLASWLVGKGIVMESIVGVSMPRSVLLVIAYLGCLKAGVAYMPLDHSLPVDRMRLMVQQANCQLILTSSECPLRDEVPTIILTQDTHILLSTPIVALPTVSSHHLSNIIFTSGSTGVPKGIMLDHRGMVNLCAPETTNWSTKMKNGLTTSIGFDPSGSQIFTSLFSGCELHCLPDGGTFDVDEFQQFIVNSGIQRCWITPSILSTLLDARSDWMERSSLKQITLGGEKLVPSQITEALRRLPHLEFASSYGPAEASVRSAYFVVDSSIMDERLCRIPIGRALPNTRIYVVDADLSPVPAGVLGEIVVAGTHLARGYLNQPVLTAERFVQTPEVSPLGSQRLYRTGDAGFWTSDGQVQFVGRMDTQLKIRGQRLEAGEVESVLDRHPAVDSSAVTVVPTQQGDQLVAYVQISADGLSKEDGVLSLWEHHYNEEDPYHELDDDVAGHDFARWVSMYNGEPIPFEEMEEWLDDTISQISPASSDRVLELGVGSGKIALNIIDRVTSFVGTDISSLVIKFMETQIDHRGLSSKLSVMQGAAHEFDSLPKGDISLAVINSVAQYFPSTDYFVQVIAKILDIMPRGRIFIGDVRSYALIPYHDLERTLATLDLDSSLADVCDTLQRYADVQSELLLSPAFFFELQAQFPRIVHVEIKPKYMIARNELSRYRYTAILHVGAPPNLITPTTWVDFSTFGQTPLDGLRHKLRTSSDSTFGALNIPIDDIQRVHALLEIIRSEGSGSSSETVLALCERLTDGLSSVESTPAALIQMAKEEGWSIVLDSSLQGRPGTYLRAIFVRGADASMDGHVGDFPVPDWSGPAHNTLVVNDLDVAAVISSIDNHLRQSLPSYMVPSQIIRVDELPLNRSGKLDRKLLSSASYLEGYDTAEPSQHVGAITDSERKVLAIFARALNRHSDTIDIRESLFNLGGHSLMATLVVAAVRREMGANLSIASFFRHPTVKDIAALISKEQAPPSSSQSKAQLVGADATIVTNEGSSGPTLFMFPESTGFASVYSSAFEHISHKVVAFGDRNWSREAGLGVDSVPSAVATLIPRIRQAQAHGPYFLSGWSLGGYMALEAAIQLHAAGESIGIVIMFDSSVYDGPLGDAKWRPELDSLLAIVNDKSAWLSQFTRGNRMISDYELSRGAYTGRVVLIKAERGRDPGEANPPPSDPSNGWGKILPQLEVLGVDSSHRRMFDSVHGPEVGRMICGILRDAVDG